MYAAASANTSSYNICCLLPQRLHSVEAKGLGGASSRSSEWSFMGTQPAHHPVLPTPPLPGRGERDPPSCRQLVETTAKCFIVPAPILLLLQGWVRKGKRSHSSGEVKQCDTWLRSKGKVLQEEDNGPHTHQSTILKVWRTTHCMSNSS